jgi:hypothetical protein
MTRALYRPGRSDAPLPDGNALPRGTSHQALDARAAIEEALTDPASSASVPRPLYATDDQYEASVRERMRTMSLAERIDIEIQLTERNRRVHTYDYDALRY